MTCIGPYLLFFYRWLITTIDPRLEGFDPDPAIGVEETFVLESAFDIDIQDLSQRIGHLDLGDGRTQAVTERGIVFRGPTKRDLVILFALLIHPEDADVSHMMMAAGIHATGHLDLDLAEIVEVVQIIEPLVDLPGDGDRAGIGERAVVKSGTADHIRERADIGCSQIMAFQRLPQ